MDDLAGWVLLGIVVLVFAYILPAVIRSRQVVVDSRVGDRYSGDLRIVATAGDRPSVTTGSTRVLVHHRQSEEHIMRSSADRLLAASDARRLAAARAARAAASSRRAAAARRRFALTIVVGLLTAAGWAGYGLLSWPLLAGVVPTLALLGVVLLGRRAAAQGDAADARWEREIAQITSQARKRVESTARASGRPQLRVDVDPALLLAEPAGTASRPAPRAAMTDGSGWTPVPVPPPAYTLKPTAPRREVSPLVMEAETEQMDAVRVEEPASDAVEQGSGEPEIEVAEAAASAAPADSAEPVMDVQAVLARRRAAG